MPNKQTRGDYGNAPNTPVPAVHSKFLKKGHPTPTPVLQPYPHPFKGPAPRKL